MRASVLAAAMRGELPNVHCYTAGKPGAKKRVASFDALLGVSSETLKEVGEAIFEGSNPAKNLHTPTPRR